MAGEVSSSGNTSYQVIGTSTGQEPAISPTVGSKAIGASAGDELFKQAHANNDVNLGNDALHHTLGTGVGSALPSSLLNNIAPIGEVLDFGGPTTKMPKGFVVCDGRSLDTKVYSKLFAVIGYEYGGSGSNFNVPDSRIRSSVGALNDSELGDNDNIALGTRTNQVKVTLNPHHHTFTPAGTNDANGSHNHTINQSSDGTHSHTGGTTDVHAHDHGGNTGTPSGTASVATGGSTAGGPNHTHTINSASHSHNVTVPSTSSAHSHTITSNNNGNHSHTFNGTAGTTGDTPVTATPTNGNIIPFIKVTKMIRYDWVI